MLYRGSYCCSNLGRAPESAWNHRTSRIHAWRAVSISLNQKSPERFEKIFVRKMEDQRRSIFNLFITVFQSRNADELRISEEILHTEMVFRSPKKKIIF